MDAITPRAALQRGPDSTRALLVRLWREHVCHYKPRLLLVLLLTLVMAGTTALYPVVIDHAFEMFTDRDKRILYQIPLLVVLVTSVKAAAQYFQNVQVQQVVLLVAKLKQAAAATRSGRQVNGGAGGGEGISSLGSAPVIASCSSAASTTLRASVPM